MSSGIVEEPSSQESGQQQQQQSGGARSQLVQQLIEASSLPAFMNALLMAQAITVAGTEAAGFLIERGAEEALTLRPIAHVRPDNSSAETRTAALNAFQELIKPCIAQAKDYAIEVPGTGETPEPQFCLVTLLRAEMTVVAVSAVVTRCIDANRARQRLMSMQLVAGYFELFTLRRAAEQHRTVAETHQHAMQLSTAVATAEGFEAAAMNLCNELATRSGATRVSLGWIRGRNVKVRALSHTEEFDKKQELIVQLEKAMEECVDQEQIVQFDPTGQSSSDNVTRDAAALSRGQGGHSVLSIPLRQKAEIVGVVTLEFLAGHQPSATVARGLSVAVDLLAPQLFDRHANDRWLPTKVGLSVRENSKLVLGPKHMLVKLCAVLIVAVLAVVILYKPMYHVSAPFEFAPIAPHAVSAPFDGYISRIAARQDDRIAAGYVRKIKPGDMVEKDEVLVELDTTDNRLKLAESRAREKTKRRESDKYRAEDKVAEAEMSLDEAEEARAEGDYLQNQIDRAVVRAPMAGQILKGDFEDKLRAPVKQGDVLFEIGSPENLHLELKVSDRDIQELKADMHQKGRFATNALPDEKYDFTVDRVIPMGEAKDGGNVFTVYGTIGSKASVSWRPGMAGEARVDVEPRRVVWTWTHRLIDFIKLKLWL